jgi:hypothetical protein
MLHEIAADVYFGLVKGMDIKDLEHIQYLSDNPDKGPAGAFFEEVSARARLEVVAGVLKNAREKLIHSPHKSVQDMATEDVDDIIADIVGYDDYKQDFVPSDLKNILFSLSQQNQDSEPHTRKLTSTFKTQVTDNRGLMIALSLCGITKTRDGLVQDSKKGLDAFSTLTPLSALGERALERLQQLDGRELVENLKKNTGFGRTPGLD